MPLHVPKRVYTASAIEEWFGRLSGDWEGLFNDHELSMGRELYQGGSVSSIELQKGHAIFHGKVDKKDIYALIEWEGETPVVRSSCEEKLSGRALAVAGLYESEELIADGASPLPPESPEEKAAARANSGGGFFAPSSSQGTSSGGGFFAPGGSKTISPMRPVAPRPTAATTAANLAASRTIMVKFVALENGLAFDAYWKNMDGTTLPALKLYAASPNHVNETERERIIRLTALARKAGFELENKKHDYVLEDFEKIPKVVKEELDMWKKYFHVEMTPEAAALAKGVQTVSVEVEALGEKGELRFNWLFLLGSVELDKKQIKQLLDGGREPVLLPSVGLAKLSDEQADVLADWRDIILSKDGSMPQYMLFSLFRQDALPIRMSKAMEEWTRSLMGEAVGLDGLPEFLRDYQRKGVAWLNHMLDHGCQPLLADEMGLGKTIQMLTLLTARMKADKRPAIVIAPASVVPVWQGEAAKHFPDRRVEVLGADNHPTDAEGVLWLASYGQLKRNAEAVEKVEFAAAVLDEAQMIKNPSTKAAKACYRLKAANRMAMTGTPVENKPMDLWSVFRFLMPGLLGGSARFEQLGEDQMDKLIGKLHQQVSPFILRRTKAEVAKELPEKVEAVLVTPLGTTQREQYARLVDQGIKRFGSDIRRASRERGLGFFTLLTRLRQASCDAGLLPWINGCAPEESGKIQTLLEKLEGIIAGGSKVVIFSQFVGFLKRIESAIDKKFPNIPRYELTGATVDRQKPVGDFQTQDGPAIMLVSLRAGGTGITLHAADYLFLMDPWWNPAVEDQAIDRVHRIGQKKTVFVYRIVSEGTVEARIQQLKAQKREIFASLVGNVRDNTHFALYFKSMQELIALGNDDIEETD